MKISWATLVLASWIGGTVYGFWHFQGRYLLPVTVDRPLKTEAEAPPTVHQQLIGKQPSSAGTWVNFWNPECGCSRFAESHVRELAREFGGKGFRIVTVIIGSELPADELFKEANQRNIPGVLMVDANQEIVRAYDILAAPAALVFDKGQKLVYRGAYNISRTCTDEETAYARKALMSVSQGRAVTQAGLPFYGCSNALK